MMKQGISQDIMAGFIVFLIALPLSLGIALASGFPASAGLTAAILGGVLGSLLSGTHVAINGPAAGLIVVILHAVTTLSDGDPVSGYKRTLACIVVAGLLQILAGLLKAGNLAFLFPSSVVHGMLAAIGAIIMIKQYPVLLGVSPKAKSLIGLVEEFPIDILHPNIVIATIGFSCLLLLLLWGKLPPYIAKTAPGPLFAVLLGIGFTLTEHLDVTASKFLVNIPTNLNNLFAFPDFSRIFTTNSLLAIFSIFFVTSLESMLSASAIDKIDPLKRHSNLSKDLVGKGVINTCCGLIGALPVISEIVRSSANIANGAKTRISNFAHGIFIALFLVCFPYVLDEIPLACLAAVLILVGFRLAHPRQFKDVASHGYDQLLIFISTMVVTIAEDLMLGILFGTILAFTILLLKGVKLSQLFKVIGTTHETENSIVFTPTSALMFSNFLSFKSHIQKLAQRKPCVLDLSQAPYIEHTFQEHLDNLHKLIESPYEITVHIPHGHDIQALSSDADVEQTAAEPKQA